MFMTKVDVLLVILVMGF